MNQNNNSEPIQKLKFKRLNSEAIPPKKGTPFSAGYDLFCIEDKIIPAGERACVKTGWQVELPQNSYGRIASRSGLACKSSIDVGAGVIDEDYRGEILILLINNGKTEFKAKKGERVAQLIIEKIVPTQLTILGDNEELSQSERGAGRFGSTGNH